MTLSWPQDVKWVNPDGGSSVANAFESTRGSGSVKGEDDDSPLSDSPGPTLTSSPTGGYGYDSSAVPPSGPADSSSTQPAGRVRDLQDRTPTVPDKPLKACSSHCRIQDCLELIMRMTRNTSIPRTTNRSLPVLALRTHTRGTAGPAVATRVSTPSRPSAVISCVLSKYIFRVSIGPGNPDH